MDTIYGPGDFLVSLFDNLQIGDVRDAQKLSHTWKSIVCGIKAPDHQAEPNRGENMYHHSKPVDIKNGVLFVETDHPGWMQLFHLHRGYILTGLNKAVPELHITTLAFRLQKQSAG
jgi:hypothetical protein